MGLLRVWASAFVFFQMGLNMDEIDLIGPIFYFDGGVVYIGV